MGVLVSLRALLLFKCVTDLGWQTVYQQAWLGAGAWLVIDAAFVHCCSHLLQSTFIEAVKRNLQTFYPNGAYVCVMHLSH